VTKPVTKAIKKDDDDEKSRGKLIVAEAHERGGVKWEVYQSYIKSIGMFLFYLMVRWHTHVTIRLYDEPVRVVSDSSLCSVGWCGYC
jgi:hypothetical protein